MIEQDGQLNDVFRALADPTRREMIRRLAMHEQTVTELAAPFPMSLAAASKHIKTLERAGLIERTIHGRTHMCRLNAEALVAAHNWFRFYERFWTTRLDALEQQLRTAKTEPLGGEPNDG